jgi:ribosomal protein L3 glutamine methyltransferase
MDAGALRVALNEASTRERWVDLVGQYFAEHEIFCGHGTDRPIDEAYWLVWHLSGQPEALAGLAQDAALSARVARLAERRVAERMPMAYLLGSAWFAGLEFEVGPGVLIPRSPLAELVESGFAPWAHLRDGDRVLEIGTGSGCIAIAAAVHEPGIRVDATEIDAEALAVARRNAARHGVTDRVAIVEADLYPPEAASYRVIMSNPPYVPTADIEALPPEYRHEPARALDGGTDGLDEVQRILAEARQWLTRDGILVVEVGVAADALVARYPQAPFTWIEFERGGDGVFLLTAEELSDGWR